MNLNEQLEKYTEEIEQIIYRYLPEESGHQKTIFEAMNYSVKAGGKRLRPLVMREVFRLFSQEEAVLEPFIAAMEMIHTSSLVHDDLPCMDNDEFRRGLPTTWVKYGYDMAVLAGDGLLMYAMETAAKAFTMTERSDLVGRCIGVLAGKSGIYGMIGGQTVDVELTGKPVSKDQLAFIYRLKTGALIEASMMIGAILGGADETEISAVEKMAADVGFAFQVQDDILDIVSSQEVLGKPVLSDEKNQKTTYVSLEGLEKAQQEVAAKSACAMNTLDQLPGDHAFLGELIQMLITREK